jgi:nitroreductase
MAINHLELLEKLNWRYATKVFDKNKKISKENLEILIQSLVLSPSSYGLQPWKFIVVENQELREKLKPVSWGQSQVTDASHFIVFTTLKEIKSSFVDEYISRISEVRGQSKESLVGYENMMKKNIVEGMNKDYVFHWNQRQAYIAMGFLLETAALLEIDTVPMEGIDPKAYDSILGLSDSDYGTVAAVALGYRDPNDKYAEVKKVRFSKEQMIQFMN